jgi:hypothetical protein
VTEKTKLGKIRVAAGLGKPAAGDADMGDVASQLTNQCSNSIENFLSVSTFDLVGYRHGL